MYNLKLREIVERSVPNTFLYLRIMTTIDQLSSRDLMVNKSSPSYFILRAVTQQIRYSILMQARTVAILV